MLNFCAFCIKYKVLFTSCGFHHVLSCFTTDRWKLWQPRLQKYNEIERTLVHCTVFLWDRSRCMNDRSRCTFCVTSHNVEQMYGSEKDMNWVLLVQRSDCTRDRSELLPFPIVDVVYNRQINRNEMDWLDPACRSLLYFQSKLESFFFFYSYK